MTEKKRIRKTVNPLGKSPLTHRLELRDVVNYIHPYRYSFFSRPPPPFSFFSQPYDAIFYKIGKSSKNEKFGKKNSDYRSAFWVHFTVMRVSSTSRFIILNRGNKSLLGNSVDRLIHQAEVTYWREAYCGIRIILLVG